MPTPTSRRPLRSERPAPPTLRLPPYLPSDESDPQAVVAAIREGLPSDAFDWLQQELELTVRELADVVHIARRTVSRRKKEGQLKPDESERVLRLIRLYQQAATVLGSPDEARAWMQEPNFALGDATPLHFADTEPGARRVEQLLGQIEHGIVT